MKGVEASEVFAHRPCRCIHRTLPLEYQCECEDEYAGYQQCAFCWLYFPDEYMKESRKGEKFCEECYEDLREEIEEISTIAERIGFILFSKLFRLIKFSQNLAMKIPIPKRRFIG